MQVNVAIVEDEAPFMQHLCRQLKRWAGDTLHQPYIRWYSNAQFFLLELEDGRSFDVIFIDAVQPGPLNGIDVARQIRRGDEHVAIIFVTGTAEHIAEGYRVAAMQYLIKPTAYEDVKECMDKVVRAIGIRDEADYCYAKGKNNLARIPYSQILFFSSSLQYTDIHTTSGVERQLERLKNIERRLPEQFIRCHRSYIVNMKAAYSIAPSSITLLDQTELPISKTYFEDVKQKFVSHFTGYAP